MRRVLPPEKLHLSAPWLPVRIAYILVALTIAGIVSLAGAALRIHVDPRVTNQGGKIAVTCRIAELQRRVHVYIGIAGAGSSEVVFDSTEPQTFRRGYVVACGNGPAYCQLDTGERVQVQIIIGCN